jgi:predicted RND superfamily exporter protein
MVALRLTRLTLRHPVTAVTLLALITALAVVGTIRLRSGNFLEGHLPEGDPAFAVFQRLVDDFGGDQIVILGIDCSEAGYCDSVFDPIALRFIHELSAAALRFRGVDEVRSIATTSVLVADGPNLRAERLGEPINTESARRFRELIQGNTTLLKTLVSTDLKATALLVRFDPSLPEDERNRAALEMRRSLTQLASKRGFQLHVSGHVIRTAETDAYVRRDLLLLTPAMVCLLAGLLAWVFRGGTSVALALYISWSGFMICGRHRPAYGMRSLKL